MLIFIEKLTLKMNKASQYLPAIAFAEILDYPRDIANTPEKVENLFNSAADWMFTAFLIVAVMAIIYTAFMYLTAADSQKKISKARVSLTVSIVAIVIALLAASVPTLLENLLREGANAPTTSDEADEEVPDPRDPRNFDPNDPNYQGAN